MPTHNAENTWMQVTASTKKGRGIADMAPDARPAHSRTFWANSSCDVLHREMLDATGDEGRAAACDVTACQLSSDKMRAD